MARTLLLKSREGEHQLRVEAEGQIRIGQRTIVARRLSDSLVRLEGSPAQLAWTVADGETRWVFLDGRVYQLEVQRERAPRRRAGRHHGALSAPMPATVRRIDVTAGDAVIRGDTLIVLEAMKMELPVRSAADGIVKAVLCREGELVQAGAVLVEMVATD